MIAGLIGSGLSVIGGLIKSGRAKKEQRRLEKQISEFRRQDLTNVADNLAVSTLGADRLLEQSARTTSTILDALQKGGARNLLSGIGSLQAQSDKTAQQAQADLDSRQKEIDRIRAADDVRIRNTQETRDNSDLAGLGNALNVARQDRAAGTSDIFSGITGIAGGLSSSGALSGLFGSGGAGTSGLGIGNQTTASAITPSGFTNSGAGAALGGLGSTLPIFG